MTVKTEKLLQFGWQSVYLYKTRNHTWRHATAWGKELNILTHHLVNVSVMFCFVLMMKSKNAASARNIPSSPHLHQVTRQKWRYPAEWWSMLTLVLSCPVSSYVLHIHNPYTISGGYVNCSFNIWVAMLPCAGGWTESKEYAIKWQGCSVTGINITLGINISWGINITTSSSLLFTAP